MAVTDSMNVAQLVRESLSQTLLCHYSKQVSLCQGLYQVVKGNKGRDKDKEGTRKTYRKIAGGDRRGQRNRNEGRQIKQFKKRMEKREERVRRGKERESRKSGMLGRRHDK